MQYYKKFIIIFFAFPVSLVVLVTIYVQLFYAKPQTLLLMKSYYDKKVSYAQSIKSNKIVISAGSNALYGLNANRIENELKIPTVNFAVNAGLNHDYIFYKTKKVLKAGDIVIIPDEYQHLIWNGELSKTKIQYILTYDRTYFNTLSLKEKIKIINTISLKNMYLSLKEQYHFNQNSIDKGKNKTNRSLDLNGDKIDNEGYYPKKIANTNSPFPLNPDNPFETQGLLDIIAFNTWCQAHNVTLYMTFPNMVKLKSYENTKYKTYFKKLITFYRKNHIRFLGQPYDFMYPENYFHDTNYHLNAKGNKIHTQKFIKLMQEEIPELTKLLKTNTDFIQKNVK